MRGVVGLVVAADRTFDVFVVPVAVSDLPTVSSLSSNDVGELQDCEDEEGYRNDELHCSCCVAEAI